MIILSSGLSNLVELRNDENDLTLINAKKMNALRQDL